MTRSRGLLGRRWQRRQAGGAPDSASGTANRRPRRILPPTAPGAGGAGLRPVEAGDGEGRAEALARARQTYTGGVRRLAAQGMRRLAATRVSPNALTAAGVLLCAAAAVLVYFENHNEYLFYWLGGAVFVVGSILDILDGALARTSGKGTPFGAFLDSTTDRISEGFVLGAIALVFARHGNQVALAFAIAAVAGSFLVSYTRARAEALGLRGDVGLGSRTERVVVIAVGLAFAPWGVLPWAIYALAATAWLTVLQRVLSVRAQLRQL